MSEQSKKQMIDALLALEKEDKAWIINILVQSLMDPSAQKKRKAKKMHHDDFTEEQWEEYFSGKTAKEISIDTLSVSELLKETSGKTIKPLEKWL